jgi:hypothetical protein
VVRLWFLGYPLIGRLSTVLQRVYLKRRSDSAFASAGFLWEDEREENCIANPSRTEVLGLAYGYKAPCRCGLSCTRKSRGCKFDHGDGGDVQCATTKRGGKRKNRRSPSAKRGGEIRLPRRGQCGRAAPGRARAAAAFCCEYCAKFCTCWGAETLWWDGKNVPCLTSPMRRSCCARGLVYGRPLERAGHAACGSVG